LLGHPKPIDILSMNSTLAPNIISSIVLKKNRTFKTFFPKATPEALDLLRKLLEFNPSKRLTANEALKHKYVKQFSDHDKEGEDIHLIDGEPSIFTTPMDDNRKFAIKDYRDKLYEELIKKRRQSRKLILERNKKYRAEK
jgi:mitogen-activated protein kinase 15